MKLEKTLVNGICVLIGVALLAKCAPELLSDLTDASMSINIQNTTNHTTEPEKPAKKRKSLFGKKKADNK